MNAFTEKVVAVLRAIPEGKVATYGQVAALAGNPRSARQVARLLHSMSAKYGLPWHRVVNAKGEIKVADPERQMELLEQEGVELGTRDQVDLAVYGWEPEGMDDDWMRG